MLLWEDLTFQDKMKLFGNWSILSIVSNILQIFGSLTNIFSVYDLIDTDNSSGNSELLIGLGCMLAWIGLVKYMETSE